MAENDPTIATPPPAVDGRPAGSHAAAWTQPAPPAQAVVPFSGPVPPQGYAPQQPPQGYGPVPPQPPQGYAPPTFAQQNNVYVMQPPKSVGVAFVLTFFFGAFGMLYSTVTGALIMLGVGVAAVILNAIIGVISFGTLDIITVPLSFLGIWIATIVWGCLAASHHNERLQQQVAAMHGAAARR